MSRNIVILGKAGTNENYIPFSLDDNGVVYTQNAPNTNAGIIQGRDSIYGGVDISAYVGTTINELATSDQTTHTLLNNFQFNNTGELLVDIGKNIEITGINITFPTAITATIDNSFLITRPQGFDGTNYLPVKIDAQGNISVVSDTLATETTLQNIDTNISQINSKINGTLTINENNDLQVYTSNILDTPLITGFNLETTQQDIKDKLDNLTFNNNEGILELNTFDSQSYLQLQAINAGVSNLPTNTFNVSVVNTEPIEITGINIPTSISVNNFPAIQPVSGTVAFSNTSIEVSNFPVSQTVSVSNFPAIQPVSFNSGITVLNFPNTQAVSGTVSVDNFPSGITVNNFPAIQPVSGTVIVGNMPGTQPISGDVSILNFPATQPVSFNSGITVNNFPVNYATETKQDTQIVELEKVVDKKGDIEATAYYADGAVIWADTVPTPGENERDPNGWLYNNAEAGNAMNLYYFNGNDETKTLNQVVGQYAVISNLSTKLNDSLIFAIYTKGSPFFTSRITHSPTSGIDLTAGGKFLCYWGSVPEDLYPSLPRLNFTSVNTVGPAIPTEEILSVSLNTNSSTPAGDVYIFVESLGVVFNNGSVNQSRVLNLLSNKTDYTLLASNTEFNQLTINYLNNLGKTNNGLDTYIVNSSLTISNTTFDIGNFPSTYNSFITNDEFTPVPVSFSGGIDVNNTVNTLITNTSPIPISGLVDINSFPPITFDAGITVNNFPVVQEVSFSAGITVNNFPTSILSKTQDASGNNITSTDLLSGKRGLDTASSLFAYTGGTTRTALTCDIAGKLMISSYTADGLGNEITSSTTSTSTNSLDTASSLYVSNGSTTRTALTATGSSLNTNITNTVPVSGTVAFSNSSIQVSNFPATQPVSGTVAVSNSSIDSHIYGSSNGTDWHHILTTPQGRILNNSSTQDGNGTNITSTLVNNPGGDKQGLDVYVSNTTQSRVFTDLGNATGTDITATKIALDTASSLYVADGTTRTAITATGSSLNTNITNTTVPVSGTVAFSNTSIEISGTASVSDTVSQGYLNTINNGIGERPASFALGNLINNGSLPAGNFSTEQTFTKGFYGRNTLLFYRDSNVSNSGSISVYSSTTSGTPSNVLLGTFYPISNGTFRQFTGSFNLLPFASIFIRNDSDTTVSSVYVSYVNG